MTTVNVKDYGAVGDSAHDDLPAFKRALAAACGRTVVIPPGSYRLGKEPPQGFTAASAENVTFDRIRLTNTDQPENP